MDLRTTGELLLYYVIVFAIFDGGVAVYSYTYYLIKGNASIEVQNQFRSTLKAPSKWLFSGEGKTPLEVLLLFWSDYSDYKTLEEYLQKHSLRYFQFSRIIALVFASLFSIPPFIGMLSEPANARHRVIPYVVFIVAQIYTLIESWRFGSELIALSQRASKTADSDGK